uniref:RFX-type winged-helix domain-containing protein n=1 Tax=Clastoptera arizonana TaxID=38151 RepID=A0A1B6CLU1_9HEMI
MIKEEILSEDENYDFSSSHSLKHQYYKKESNPYHKLYNNSSRNTKPRFRGGGEGVTMATTLGGNNNSTGSVQSSLSANGSPTTITVVATGTGNPTILQVTPGVISVQPRAASPNSAHSISITAVAAAQQTTLQQNGNVLDSPGSSSDSNHPVGDSGGPDPESNTSPDQSSTAIVDSHYITVQVPDQDTVGSDGVSHSTYVQYVEGTPEQAIYTTTNGQMAYPVYTVGTGESGTMYTPASGQYYSANNSTPVTYTQVANSISQSGQSQLLANTTYLIQQSVENEHALIAARASPQTVTAVQWLLENYETAEGVSLPRSTLYNHYLRHCYDNKLDPVNAASFGKLIRSVFLGLRTRRLGTRGNSKYHYYGIRIKPNSNLNQLSLGDEGSPVSGRGISQGHSSAQQKRYKLLHKGETTQDCISNEQNHSSNHASQSHNHQFLGDGSGAIPDFPDIETTENITLPEDCTLEDVDTLRSIYREHCEAFLDAIVNLEFITIESLWREFWRSQDNNNGDECEEEKYLSKTKLYLLSKYQPVQEFIRRVDYLFYQNLVEVLIPDVLRPIPSSLTQAIRNFAKGLESWLKAAMVGCPQDMVDIKVTAVGAFAQTLRRYTSLNHLAQAARAVLQNAAQINQMLTDLNRVDFHNVQEQASWVCQCDGLLVQRLEEDFKLTLQQQNSLEEWAGWLKNVVATVLKPYQGKPNFTKAARQFLLKWSFYSSMVIRDLTLRSAASFGSFHLIRLLYDEYMFYLIEHQVAVATGETPIAVMGEKCCNSSLSDYDMGSDLTACNGGVSLVDQNLIGELHLPVSKRLKIS